jgi:hypothetical protein
MVLGAIWCSLQDKEEAFRRVREIKINHGLSKNFEIKWTKISPAQEEMYLNLIDYFFDNDGLHFRGLVVPDKSILRHQENNQDHDTWYYKMYFNLLKVILDPEKAYNIYVDYKDTLGAQKIEKLREVLESSLYDFDQQIVKKIQIVRSENVELVQITDLIIGALSYYHRNITSSAAKTKIIEKIRERSSYSLERTTLYRENKFNLLIWTPRANGPS